MHRAPCLRRPNGSSLCFHPQHHRVVHGRGYLASAQNRLRHSFKAADRDDNLAARRSFEILTMNQLQGRSSRAGFFGRTLRAWFQGHGFPSRCRRPFVSTSQSGQIALTLQAEHIARGYITMVLPERIELSTSPLPRECSTTELRQHRRVLNAGVGLASRYARKRGDPCHKAGGGATSGRPWAIHPKTNRNNAVRAASRRRCATTSGVARRSSGNVPAPLPAARSHPTIPPELKPTSESLEPK